MAMGGKWKIVGRLFYDRVSIIVPPGSPIERVLDLKGKKVASPNGSTGHRETFLAQEVAGLDSDTDVEYIDMDILEIRRRVLEGGVETWEGIDAATIWEPDNSGLRLAGLTRNLTEMPALGVVAMSDEFIARHPEAATQFLVALLRSWYYLAQDPSRVMRWYNDDTQLDYDPESLLEAIGIDPNFQAGSLQEIDMALDGAVLAMMAFVIALTFGSATNRFDARKNALLDDVTAIQTAYLQTSMLPEPHRTTLRSLLRDYVQARAGIVHSYGDPETLDLVQGRARRLQDLMWNHIEVMAEEYGSSGSHQSFASALNQMFNLHTKRVVLRAYYRIPGFLWWAIIFASAVAMVAVGFQFGMASGRCIMTTNLALALTFALVITLAFDLDRAGEGLISVNQKPMIDLYQGMSQR